MKIKTGIFYAIPLLMILSFASGAFGMWKEISIGTTSHITQLKCLPTDFTYTLIHDTLFYSNTFGTNWHAKKITPGNLKEICFWDEQTGWAIEEGSYEDWQCKFFKTSNGGISWDYTGSLNLLNVHSITTLSDQDLFIAGWSPDLERPTYSSDGGTTFQESTISGNMYFNKLSVTYKNNLLWGIARPETNYNNYAFQIGMSKNKGVSWRLNYIENAGTNVALDQTYDVYAQFLDTLMGWVTYETYDEEKILLATQNGGDSWTSIPADSVPVGNLFQFCTIDTGYQLRNGVIFRTDDGGVTWNQFYKHSSEKIEAFYFKDCQTGLAVGTNGLVVSYDFLLPPVAHFKANITTGLYPLSVLFSDSSTGEIDSWFWDFGDGGTSTEKNPTHVYHEADTFSVTLIVRNSAGSDTLTREDYIRVKEETGVDPYLNVPIKYKLFQNYPNPFNPATSIQYTLKETCPVWIAIFNAQGQIVQVLQDRIQERGIYTIRWDASGHSSGIYMIQIKMGSQTRMRKMIKLD